MEKNKWSELVYLCKIVKDERATDGGKLWEIFLHKIDNYEPNQVKAKFGLHGSTLFKPFKETMSRSKKFVKWHKECINAQIRNNLGHGHHLTSKKQKERKQLKARLLDFSVNINRSQH